MNDILVKFCGITRLEDAQFAVAAGASYLGFIFAKKSPRYISPEHAAAIIRLLPDNVQKVGVFVNEPLDSALAIAGQCGLDIFQLHGDESAEYAEAVGTDRVWKAFSLKEAKQLDEVCGFPCQYVLTDSGNSSQRGGTGKTCDWSLARKAASQRPLILAGGLSPDNIKEALSEVRPDIVDVNSGVETAPGIKDHEKIKQVMTIINKFNQEQKMKKTKGKYGIYGGQFVAETLMPALHELTEAYEAAIKDEAFMAEYRYYLEDYVGRPSPLYFAQRLTEHCGGAKIYLKREDLNHTGAHKVNNTIGQALLAKRMGKKRLIAETGAGMHGVATATVAALFGFECDVFMGSEDIHRQAPNVQRMHALGAKVIAVDSGAATLKDAMNEALRNWVATVDDTFYVIGTVAGPHPYPEMVREFQAVIGTEAREQCLKKEGRLPDEVIACVGGGSNAMGIFAGFIIDPDVELIGVEAGGSGIHTGMHAASICGGRVGVLHGCRTYLLQDKHGQIIETHSVSAGLDYPGVGPEHSYMGDSGRAKYVTIDDDEAVAAFDLLCRMEGIIPALESSHALAQAIKSAPNRGKDDIIIVNLSGRGDKDMDNVREYKESKAK